MIVKAFTGKSCDSRSEKKLIIYDKDHTTAKQIVAELETRNIYLSYNLKKSDNFKVVLKGNETIVICDGKDRDVRSIVDRILNNY